MSRTVSRFAHPQLPQEPVSGAERPFQLSLFDFRPEYRLVCLPMVGLHGNAFQRVMGAVKPTMVLDTRRFPTFDLTDLDRSAAFRFLETCALPYVHRHIKLGAPGDHRARWGLRAEATRVVTEVVSDRLSAGFSIAVLLHGRTDIEVLDAALRHSDADRGSRYVVEPPDAYGFAPPSSMRWHI
ncbi:hypothetical protein ACIQW5_18820 [Methylorubrum thiocyanatum]|uniref:hypothetical protein n=1 Tax=Methylorubrum thiocyanatum TaxID=47958 RepID=UPI00383A535F